MVQFQLEDLKRLHLFVLYHDHNPIHHSIVLPVNVQMRGMWNGGVKMVAVVVVVVEVRTP